MEQRHYGSRVPDPELLLAALWAWAAPAWVARSHKWAGLTCWETVELWFMDKGNKLVCMILMNKRRRVFWGWANYVGCGQVLQSVLITRSSVGSRILKWYLWKPKGDSSKVRARVGSFQVVQYAIIIRTCVEWETVDRGISTIQSMSPHAERHFLSSFGLSA